MNASARTHLVGSSLAAVLRAGASMGVNVVVPLALVHLLVPADYRVWALAFSLASYAIYVDLGLLGGVQAVAGRLFGGGAVEEARRVAVTATLVLAGLGAGIAIAISLGSPWFGRAFPSVPGALLPSAAMCTGLLVAGFFANTILNMLSGYFTAARRYKTCTVVVVTVRIACAVAVVGSALLKPDLLLLASVYCVTLVAGVVVLATMVGFARDQGVARSESSTPIVALLNFSAPLMVWNLCLLAAASVGPVAVGRMSYQDISIYALAIVLLNLVTGFASAALTPLVSELARRVATGDEVGPLTTRAVGANATIVMAAAGVAIATLPILASATDGASRSALLACALTLFAGVARVCLSPLGLLFVASGRHRRIFWVPVLEALVTVVAVWSGSVHFGITGTGLGSLVGATAGIAVMLCWVVPAHLGDVLVTSTVARAAFLLPVATLLLQLGGAIVAWRVVNEYLAVVAAGVVGTIAVATRFRGLLSRPVSAR